MQILDSLGKPISTTQKVYDSFFAWKQNTLDPSSMAAWNHQELKLKAMRDGFAEAVCHGKEGLRVQIEEQRKTIDELKKFCEENIKLISELEIENMKLKGNLQ